MLHENAPTNVIILHKGIRPQRLFSSVMSKTPPEVYGREGRWYLSKEMADVKEWCTKCNLEFSFEYFQEKGIPFLDENMLGVVGELTEEMMADFPLRYSKVEKLC